MKRLSVQIWILLIIACIALCQACFTAEANKKEQWVELGRHLFFDNRLSVNNTRSCATCHNPQLGFTDGYKKSLGAYADVLQRNTLPLFNLQEQKYFTAADSSLHSVLQQMDNPLFKTHPIEMGLEKGSEQKVIALIRNDAQYAQKFKTLQAEINFKNIKKAVASFVLQIESYGSPYDSYLKGDSAALTANQKLGKQIFFSSTTNCAQCHGGKNFNEPSSAVNSYYFNTGLYNVNNKNSYPVSDIGLAQVSKSDADNGKFKVPTLRNLLFTAPYYHDGSEESLAAVLKNYASGGRQIAKGEFLGDGRLHQNKHPLIKGFTISENEQLALVDFLYALTDSSILHNKSYKSPF
jgi:cytochrome c peroxidase